MDGKGYRVSCGCVMEGFLSPRQMAWRAFLAGLTWGAYPNDYREREKREGRACIDHILDEHYH